MAIYTGQLIDLVWRKGKIVEGYDPTKWRQDFAGAWIYYDAYGTTGDYGWEIDHIHPLSLGGEESINNLMPIQWQNNMEKANHYPEFKSIVSSDGNKKTRKEQTWVIR